MAKGPIARCIECDEKIQFEEQPRLGMLIICDSCGAELEVVRKSPLELDWPYVEDDEAEEDDFEYDEDDDFDYDDDEFDEDDFDYDDEEDDWDDEEDDWEED